MGHGIFQVASEAGKMDGIRAAMAIMRQKLLEALHRVDVFSALSQAQLELLRDTMIEAPYNSGEWVFEQGDSGDAFYVITEGSAVVLRHEGDDDDDKILAELSDGAYFGERALIKNDTRYAGIRATSRKLHTMCITRANFEAVLGKLEDLIPDKY